MASIFTRIIEGELPGRFVWRDATVVALLTIEPMRPGHTLVVPRAEIDHWIDMPDELRADVFRVAHVVGQAIDRAFSPKRVGVMIVGDEVAHAHVHVVPIDNVGELSFAAVDRAPSKEALESAARRIRTELREMGRAEVAD